MRAPPSASLPPSPASGSPSGALPVEMLAEASGPICSARHYAADCPTRLMLEQIADKWSMLVLSVLDEEPLRFNAVRRQLEGITQKALTQCLRRLERNGLVTRTVIASSPVAVRYEMTALGRTLQPVLRALNIWTEAHWPEVRQARARFDESQQS